MLNRQYYYYEIDRRVAESFGLDGDELHEAITAVWSSGNPQTMPRHKAQDYGLAALLAVKRLRERRLR